MSEGLIRLAFFIAVFGLFAGLETLFARRDRVLQRKKRWVGNFSLVVIDTIMIRIIFPLGAVGVAVLAEENQMGLQRVFPDALSEWYWILATIVLLDLVVYWQHRLFHFINFFWRFHKVHHADKELDASSGFRFHPVEIFFSMIIKGLVIYFVGLPAEGVFYFEIILSSLAIFNHSNLAIPVGADRILRLFVVTPDMHRIHHSVTGDEMNRNFGFNIPWWDKIFRSYKSHPQMGQTNMVLGLEQYRESEWLRPWSLFKLPFGK